MSRGICAINESYHQPFNRLGANGINQQSPKSLVDSKIRAMHDHLIDNILICIGKKLFWIDRSIHLINGYLYQG